MRFQQYMTGFNTVSTLLYQLNDMKTIFGLHYFRDLIGVLQVESNIGICRIQHTTSGELDFATANGRTTVFRIHTSQRRETGLTLCYTVGKIAQAFLYVFYFFQRYFRLLGNYLHLHLRRYIGNTILRQIFEITTHLGRRNFDFTNQFLLHLLYFQPFTGIFPQCFTNLTGSFIEVFFHLFT